MKLTGGTGNSLGQNPGLFVYENGHVNFRFWILDFGLLEHDSRDLNLNAYCSLFPIKIGNPKSKNA
jgi:hypothetical protein